MKKIVWLLVFLMFFFSLPLEQTHAAEKLSLKIVKEGVEIPFTGKLIYKDFLVYVPLTDICNAAGVEYKVLEGSTLSLKYDGDEQVYTPTLIVDGKAYIGLREFADLMGFSDNVYKASTYFLLLDEASKVETGKKVTEDMYGFKITYNQFRTYQTTDSNFTFDRGPYDAFGNDYTVLSLGIQFDEEGANVPAQYTDVEKIMKQQIKGKVVDAMMKFAKQKPPWGGMKQKVFKDGTYMVYVDSDYNYTTKNYSDIQFSIFRKPMMGNISAHNIHGFNIAYDTNTRYTKNHLTIMKDPFGTDEAQDGRLLIIGVGYEEKTKNWSTQYAEVGMILKQHLDAKTVKGITNHMKLVYKNAYTGAATERKIFKSNGFKVTVGNGPAGGIELIVYKDGE